MSIQTSFALDGETDPQPLAEVIQLPGVELVDEQDPAEDIHVHDITCSPLWESHGRLANQTFGRGRWSGEIVTDAEEIKAIRARVEAGVARDARRGAWRRTLRKMFRGGDS